MKSDIRKSSPQYLHSVFISLERNLDYVFWIRNQDMSQQIYTSHNYDNIWQQDRSILYDIPLIWLDYLEPVNKASYMKQLQERHNCHYLDQSKNLIYFQIKTESDCQFISDKCYLLKGNDSLFYIAGISKRATAENWDSQRLVLQSISHKDQQVHQDFFHLLNEYFGLSVISSFDSQTNGIDQIREIIIHNENVSFSSREIECLQHLCDGNTAKQTAKLMNLSPRTVETFLENIRIKSGCQNKLKVIGRFIPYFDKGFLNKPSS